MTLVSGHRLTFSKANFFLRDISIVLITWSCLLGFWSQMLASAVLNLCPPGLCHKACSAMDLEITTEYIVHSSYPATPALLGGSQGIVNAGT